MLTQPHLFKLLPAILGLSILPASRLSAGVLYPDPPGGWAYTYHGDQATAGAPGSGFTSLDGTWSHDNGSDEWDGSTLGGTFGPTNRPGGAGVFEEGGIKFLRIQDTGDPRDYGFADPGSNRKIYFGHDLTAAGASDTIMDDGITLTFRARIPTPAKSTSPLDPLHRDGQQAAGVQPYPPGGDGYVTSDGGKGNFVIRQAAGGAIAFSLSVREDTAGGDPNGPRANFAGLTMNEFAGNAISGNVNFGQGTGTNVVAFDPTDWHEIWIVIRKDPANVGTHQGFIYLDGNFEPTVFKLTAGTGSDYGQSYIAVGSTATPQNSALDIDFVAYKPGVHFPPGFAEPPGGWDYVYHGDQATAGAPGSGFTSLDGTWSHDNGSDEWDGSTLGGAFGPTNRPGGAGVFEEGGIKFLRIQDTGDPRDYGFADPGSNRKIYFGHDLTAAGASDTIMDDGITLTFRARIPTPGKSTSPLDPLHRDGQQAAGVQPYPPGGDGYVTSDGGKGNFVIRQAAGGAIAFSLSVREDTAGGDPNGPRANFAGLTMNEFAGNAISGNVNFGQGTGTNVVAFDPTDWHEIWIVIRKDPANVGTHQGFIYLDGNFEPTVFKLTAGTGSDYGQSYIAVGSTATPQNSALDIDFLAYKKGVHFPGNAIDSLPPEISDVVPAQNSTFQDAAAGISFKAATQGNNSLPPSGFSLVLNGENVSAGLNVTGTAQNRTVTYRGLAANTVYRGEIIVRDDAGRASTNRLAFDTFSESTSVVIESEDYNFAGGQFIEGPQVGGYLEQIGTPGVDYQDTAAAPAGGASSVYRSQDAVATSNSLDTPRAKFANVGLNEVQVSGVQAGEWLNYTRTIPAGRYHLHLRAGSAGVQAVRVDRVTDNRTQPGQTTELLGVIAVPNTGGVNAFGYGTLVDVHGTPLSMTLSGVTTLRLTALSAANNLSMNYLVLAPVSAPAAPQVAALPQPGAVGVAPDATLRAVIFDGPSVISPASIKVLIDGQDVTSTATITDRAEGLAVAYRPANLLSGGSRPTLKLEYEGGSAEWSFTVASLPALRAPWATDAASVAGRPRGFAGKIHKVDNAANSALFPNTIQRATDQLANKIIDPATGQPFTNEAAGPQGDGSFLEPNAINYEQTGLEEGLPGDQPFPNLLPEDHNYIAMQVNTYVELPLGVVRLGVACDDGFVVYAGPSIAEAVQTIGVREPGGSTAPVAFDFIVEKSGIYALKLLFFEGVGGADIEWYSEDRETGTRSLLNTSGSYRAFASRNGDGSNAVAPVVITAALSGGDIVISWPTPAAAFVLETSPTLSPASWSNAPGAAVAGGGTTSQRVPLGSGAFFRLRSL